jgi:SOS response regulatory protein OraA/RecX
MIESRFFLYVAIAILSLSFTVLGYLSLSSYPSIGAILGFIIGGVLSAFLARITLTLQDSHKLLNRHLAKRNEQSTRIEQAINQLESLNLQDTLKTYVDELKKTSQQNKKQKQVLEQLDNLYVSLKSWDSETDMATKIAEAELPGESKESRKITEHNKFSSDSSVDKTKNSTKFQEWFRFYGTELVSHRVVKEVDSSLDKTAFFIGQNYKNLAEVMQKMCQSILTAYQGFEVEVSTASTHELSILHKFVKRMKQSGFINCQHYQNKDSDVIKVVPLKNEKTQFLTFRWPERFTYQMLNNFLQKRGADYDVVINPKIKMADDKLITISFAFFIKETPFLFDCKATTRETHISKYAKFSKIFGLEGHQVYFVTADYNKQYAEQLAKTHDIKILSPAQISSELGEIMNLLGI